MSGDAFVFLDPGGPDRPADERRVPVVAGDSVLLALARAGVHPAGGGTLCFAGDCPNCLCTVDGVSYVRACRTDAATVEEVEPHPASGEPPLPPWSAEARSVTAAHRSAEVVVVGDGPAGREALASLEADGRSVELYGADNGDEVIGLYPGPLVVVRTPLGMVHIECERVIIATGAAEIQPVVPGSDLIGILTPRAAELLVEAGIDLGRTVTISRADELVRFEGTDRVVAVVTEVDGEERTKEADTVIVDLGLYPRDGLARMAGPEPVTVVGDATIEPTVPPCPAEGVVCPCGDVTVSQLTDLYERGFTTIELLKRGSLAGTGTCQGGVCGPYLRSFLVGAGEELRPSFTARPVTRQLTLDEIAAGSHLPAVPRTALDAVHRELGARMDRIGGWWRPWTYGDTDAEYHAVRHRVSIGDVSTLGKVVVAGPDAEAMLQRLYPTDVSTIRPGRSRYALLLDERGYVLDDGMIAREPDGTFNLTFTSGGASMAEMWLRDWSASWGHDVRILNQTFSLGAINVTGPHTAELLARAGVDRLPPFLGHGPAVVAGVPCKLYRLSFTGEASVELHHPAARSEELWRALLDLGTDLDVAPHGIEALFRLRLEKGHIIVGQDTDYDSTPRRLQHEWAVNLDKGDFIGRHAVARTNRIPLDRKLVGFVTDGAAPFEGAVVWHGDDYAGYVTSSAWSPILDSGIALGWLDAIDAEAGVFPSSVTIDGLAARVVAPHFYDPDGVRARA